MEVRPVGSHPEYVGHTGLLHGVHHRLVAVGILPLGGCGWYNPERYQGDKT